MVQEVKNSNSNILRAHLVVSDTDNISDSETTTSSSDTSEYANNMGTNNLQLEMLKVLQKLDQKLDQNPRASKRQRNNNNSSKNTSYNNRRSILPDGE